MGISTTGQRSHRSRQPSNLTKAVPRSAEPGQKPRFLQTPGWNQGTGWSWVSKNKALLSEQTQGRDFRACWVSVCAQAGPGCQGWEEADHFLFGLARSP